MLAFRRGHWGEADAEDFTIAYQSALLTTPLAILRILASLLLFPLFLRIVLTLLLIIPSLYMA